MATTQDPKKKNEKYSHPIQSKPTPKYQDNCYNLYLISGESFCSTHGILGFLTKRSSTEVNPVLECGMALNTKVAYGIHLSQLVWSSRI
jgi:hypothetical protein